MRERRPDRSNRGQDDGERGSQGWNRRGQSGDDRSVWEERCHNTKDRDRGSEKGLVPSGWR